jgi:hypothetical protein
MDSVDGGSGIARDKTGRPRVKVESSSGSVGLEITLLSHEDCGVHVIVKKPENQPQRPTEKSKKIKRDHLHRSGDNLRFRLSCAAVRQQSV